jgi:hypothetical protein
MRRSQSAQMFCPAGNPPVLLMGLSIGACTCFVTACVCDGADDGACCGGGTGLCMADGDSARLIN